MSKDMILLAMKHDPWLMEEWAEVVLLQDHSSEVAIRMMLSYLNIVEGLLSRDDITKTQCLEKLQKASAPSTTHDYYWDAALRWKDRVDAQGNPTYTSTAKQRLDPIGINIQFLKMQQEMKQKQKD
jgi:hypothetical protein